MSGLNWWWAKLTLYYNNQIPRTSYLIIQYSPQFESQIKLTNCLTILPFLGRDDIDWMINYDTFRFILKRFCKDCWFNSRICNPGYKRSEKMYWLYKPIAIDSVEKKIDRHTLQKRASGYSNRRSMLVFMAAKAVRDFILTRSKAEVSTIG